MKLTVDGRKAKAEKASSVRDLLAALSLNSEETLVKINGKLAPDSAKIKGSDSVKVMRVIYGG